MTLFFRWDANNTHNELPYYDPIKGVSIYNWLEAETREESRQKMITLVGEENIDKYHNFVIHDTNGEFPARLPKENQKSYLSKLFRVLPLGQYEDFIHSNNAFMVLIKKYYILNTRI